MNYKVVRICDSDALSVIPKESVRFDLDRCDEVLKSNGLEVENVGVMITTSLDGVEITLYRNGRLMFHPLGDKDRAGALADRFFSIISEGVEKE